MRIEYPFTVEAQEDGKFLVQFVDFPEAFTEGATLEEAAFNAQEVLSLVLEQRIEDNVVIPLPSPGFEHRIAPIASVQAALLIRLTRVEEHKTLADIARALETSWPSAQRLENPRGSPTLKQLERAANALGCRLVLEFTQSVSVAENAAPRRS